MVIWMENWIRLPTKRRAVGRRPSAAFLQRQGFEKQQLREITAARALIRRISGIKSSRISKDRCEATCQVTKPKTNIMSDYISHDDDHDIIDPSVIGSQSFSLPGTKRILLHLI